jgi:hypothetical protein
VGPLGLGGPVLEVDTGGPVDVTAVASWVKQQPEWDTPPPTHNLARRLSSRPARPKDAA